MYTVAINTGVRKFSITCRDLDRSTHWHQTINPTPQVVYDTRNPEYKPYTVIGQFPTETEARKFKAVVEAAYLSTGYEQEFINA